MKLLAATGNKHKIEEFAGILEPLGVEFVSPDEIGGIPEPEENGTTFEENAAIKAIEAANFADIPAFADDSGLEVEALDNAPGIYSSRYAENDEKRIARVLKELEEAEKNTGISNRRARFVCVAAFAEPGMEPVTFRGEVYGTIIREPRGEGGFGYDPVFVPDGYDRTFAELPAEVKNTISHRSAALKKAADFFRELN